MSVRIVSEEEQGLSFGKQNKPVLEGGKMMHYKQNSLKDTKTLVLLSLFAAIIIVMTYVPYTGYITYGVISITTLHVPVIIGAALLGPINGLILGTVWGLTNLIKAFMTATPEGLLFMNPLISVVPRMIVGLFAGFLAVALFKLIKHQVVRYTLIAFAGTLCNTILVLSAIFTFGDNAILPVEALKSILAILLSLNFGAEVLLAMIVAPTVVIAVRKAIPGGIV